MGRNFNPVTCLIWTETAGEKSEQLPETEERWTENQTSGSQGKFSQWSETFENNGARNKTIYTAVSTKVVQLKSIKAYATIPKGMMVCGCSLLHRQVHEFSARWKAVL